MLSSKSLTKISFKDDTPTPQQNSAPSAGVSQKSSKKTDSDLAVKMKRKKNAYDETKDGGLHTFLQGVRYPQADSGVNEQPFCDQYDVALAYFCTPYQEFLHLGHDHNHLWSF